MLPDFTPIDEIVAYSYIRFSTPDQMKGDSLRRQTEAALQWCQRNKARLNTSITLHDLGKSAFTGRHRKNPDRYALAAFLRLVEQGRIPRGAYLIVESLDRLTREHIRPALTLLLNLIEAGIRIVQLKPVEVIYDEDVEPMQLMMALMELSRGNSESAMKSTRNGAAWVEKRGKARAEGKLMTRSLPAWVEVKDGKPCLVPERAAIVKRIFLLAASGYGNKLIVRRFMDEGVPAFGTSGKWVRNYLQTILADRRAVGEFQPRGTNGEPDGDPIPNYFPAVVTEDEFHAARAGAVSRRTKPGRVGNDLNLFAGLLRHARDGGTYFCRTLGKKDRNRRVLMNSWAQEGLAKCYSLDYPVFEEAVLSCLREINPHDILNGDTGPDETIVLAGELARVEALIAALAAELEHGDVAALARKLREKEAEKATLSARLAEA